MLEEQIYDNFNLPIDFISNTYETPENLYDDLELLQSHKDVSNVSFYEKLINPQTPFSHITMQKISEKYSTDVDFLKDTQKFFNTTHSKQKLDHSVLIDAWNSYKDIKEDVNFMDNYQYINFDMFKSLNTSVIFLTILSIYSILSPLLNLIAPVLILIVPFLIMRLKGMSLTFTNYWRLLVASLQKHSFGKLLTDWNSLPWSQKSYSLIMFGMYVYNIYQNAISCRQFYRNTTTINTNIKNISKFLENTRNKISNMINRIDPLKTYNPYQKYLQTKLEDVNNLYSSLKRVPVASFHPSKITKIGYIMQQYYKLYESEKVNQTILFCFGFWGFSDNIGEIGRKISENSVSPAKFSKSNKAIFKVKNAVYPILSNQKDHDKNVSNTIELNTNKLITGPNASGKTTLLKNAISNLLISQQLGYGFYKKALITPFDHIHCYLNIPDTSSRDSLFQAEARRCLSILNTINDEPNKKHFCIFDELFSGTNPYEAISSANSYLSHITKNKNVKFMLTTHFIDLCKKLNNNKAISNINMETEIINDKPQYFYKIKDGISEIKGALTVLKDLGYPENIIKNTSDVMENL